MTIINQVNAADVFYAYRLLLGREPDKVGFQSYLDGLAANPQSLDDLRRTFIGSVEFARANSFSLGYSPTSIFEYFNSDIDIAGTIRHHTAQNLAPHPDYLTNFLGVRIDPKFFPPMLDGHAGEIEPVPIPANWHADMSEWGAALRAVDLAGARFTIIELGCGWACWMNNTGVAARVSGRQVHVIGVEGDAAHMGFARESLATNGFAPDEITLFHGIAAATSGTALFPQGNRDGLAWGAEPRFGVTDVERDAAVASGAYDVLKMFTLAELSEGHDIIDLLHVDIQGGEADLIAGSLNLLKQKVRYIVIGTHSRILEGRLFDILLSEGWKLEVERPGLLHLQHTTPYMHVDGVQGWRNPNL